MEFQGREVPEEAFRALARRIFQSLLDDQDQQVADAKAWKWFSRDPETEQQMFDDWMKQMGVRPFAFREPPARGGITRRSLPGT